MNKLIPRSIFRFYVDGFRSMTVGKVLWQIILVKLFIMFAILKFFFFPGYLHTNFDTDEERAGHVLDMITLSAERHNPEQKNDGGFSVWLNR